MKDKILVTGAAGFIGFHLTKSLLIDGYEVLGIDNLNNYYDPKLKNNRLGQLNLFKNFNFKNIDISDKDSLRLAFISFNPDKVVNLAAQAGVRYSIDHPYTYMQSNLVGFLNIIELCRHNNVKGLIYASSSSVYGGNTKTPFSENDIVDNPISLYAATKKSNELIANTYSHLYGLHTTGLRYFTVYGAWGRPDMSYYIFTDKILHDKKITVFNHGNMIRDFTYIDDIISGTRAAITKNYKCQVFNLGNNKREKLMDIINYIEKKCNKKAIIDFQPIQPGDVKETYANINKSAKMLDYKPKTNFENGISKFINWYKEYYKKKFL